jgi:hypothetical protein
LLFYKSKAQKKLNGKIKERLPQWINVKNEFDICLSDDLDSLLSCYYLTKYRGWPIKYFYDFTGLYKTAGIKTMKNTAIGVDIDLYEGRCLGNHIVNNKNEDCINLHKLCNINRYNYHEKYAGNTILMVLSILNVDINLFTKDQQEILLSIDTMFKSYFYDKEKSTYYINYILEYPELIHILEKHNADYFYNIMRKYNLFEKIYIDSQGLLNTEIKLTELSKIFNIDLRLPQQNFEIIRQFEIGKGVPYSDDIFSLAWTYKNSAIYSYL